MNTKRRHIMPENIRISAVEVPYTTERYVYFAGNRGRHVFTKINFIINYYIAALTSDLNCSHASSCSTKYFGHILPVTS